LLICLLTSHIDWHLDAGLAIVFAEDVADVATRNPVSGKSTPFMSTVHTLIEGKFSLAAWKNLCPTYDALSPGQL
jgi:iron transport multicopper oxidase